VVRCPLSLQVVVDGGNLIVGLLYQITVRQNITTAVVKECVGVDIARARGVIKLRGVVCRLRVSIVIEVD